MSSLTDKKLLSAFGAVLALVLLVSLGSYMSARSVLHSGDSAERRVISGGTPASVGDNPVADRALWAILATGAVSVISLGALYALVLPLIRRRTQSDLALRDVTELAERLKESSEDCIQVLSPGGIVESINDEGLRSSAPRMRLKSWAGIGRAFGKMTSA